jgi:transposase
MKYYIGADQHARSVRLAVVDEEGRVVAERTINSSPVELLNFVMKYAPDVTVAVEAMGSHYWLVDALEDAEIDVQLAHPLMLKAISYAKVKTDKADALTIAKLLRLGMLPKAFIYPRALRSLRDLSRRRQRFVADRSINYRHIQNVHTQAAMAAPSRAAVKEICVEELVGRFHEVPVKIFVGSLHAINTCFTTEIDKIEDHIYRECKGRSGYVGIRKIPGAGPIYGQMILLESEGISRFPSHRQYVSYARLVPGADNSGSRVRSGHNPNQGNARLKNAFRQVAVHAVMFDPTIKHFFDRKLKVVHRKNIAYAIVARKIAIGAYYVMRDNVEFDVERLFGPAPKESNTVIDKRRRATASARASGDAAPRPLLEEDEPPPPPDHHLPPPQVKEITGSRSNESRGAQMLQGR